VGKKYFKEINIVPGAQKRRQIINIGNLIINTQIIVKNVFM